MGKLILYSLAHKGIEKREPMALQSSLTWQLKARRRTLLWQSPEACQPWALDFLLNRNMRKFCWLFCKSISKDADVHFCALFHFLLYAFTLSFIAGMNNLASPVLRTKNTEASFCLRAPSPCQDCDRHFSGPPNKKSPALTLQLKE